MYLVIDSRYWLENWRRFQEFDNNNIVAADIVPSSADMDNFKIEPNVSKCRET